MDGGELASHVLPRSVTGGDFDRFGIGAGPNETPPPLVVDADAVLALPVAGEGFEPIPGWDAQIVQVPGNVQLFELKRTRPACSAERFLANSTSLRLGGVAVAELDAVAVLLDGGKANALHCCQLIGTLERAVGIAVRNDGLRLGRADTVQRVGERGGIGGVDVHRAGGEGGKAQYEGEQQGLEDEGEGVHGGVSEGGWMAVEVVPGGEDSVRMGGLRGHRWMSELGAGVFGRVA